MNKRYLYTAFLFVALAILAFLVILVFLAISLIGAGKNEDVVVVYVAHDQDYSEPILKEFEEKSGIKVKALYDTEATKTVGLVNRLLVEKARPSADVFWNNEPIRSVVLKKSGVLQPYCSPNADDISDVFKDDECYWIGFAARARVLFYSTEKISEGSAPTSIFDLAMPQWKGKVCIANPTLGSTSTHAAALFATLGEDDARKFFLDLKSNGIQIVESNSMVRDQVVVGECWLGLTDTDDAYDAISAGKAVKMVFTDQQEDGIGNLVFPNTVMLIKDAPHPENGKKLIDFLLTSGVEEKLAASALQIPLKSSSSPTITDVAKPDKEMVVSFEKTYEWLGASNEFLLKEFLV